MLLDVSDFVDLPTGGWTEPPIQTAVVALHGPQDTAYGFMVLGLNPYRLFDDAYADFLDLLAGQVAEGITAARAFEFERRRAELAAREAFSEQGTEDSDGPIPERILGPQELGLAVRLADYLVLALPGTPETRALVNADVIGCLPAHAWVVNVGRGSAVDEGALAEALCAERLGGAVLDVFADEPLPRDSPLWTLPNVLVTPHVAGLSRDDVLVELLIENLRRLAREMLEAREDGHMLTIVPIESHDFDGSMEFVQAFE